MTENNPKIDVDALAAGYDEIVKNDPLLKMELEAKERMFQDKQAAKRAKKAKEEEEKKKLKNRIKRRRRARFHWF